MKRVTLLILILFALTAAPAMAASAHFVSASAGITGGNLQIDFKESGLGNNLNVDYLGQAQASATWVCVNGGGKVPSDPKKTTVVGAVRAAATFSPKNGTVSQSLLLDVPDPGAFSCPSGQRVRLANVTWWDVSITDLTNNQYRAIPGTFSIVYIPL